MEEDRGGDRLLFAMRAGVGKGTLTVADAIGAVRRLVQGECDGPGAFQAEDTFIRSCLRTERHLRERGPYPRRR